MKQKIKNKISRNIKLDYINCFLTNMNMQSSIWVLYLAYCGMNLVEVGVLEGIYHATSILCEIPSGAAADLLGRKKSMLVSKVCVALSCMIMIFSRNFFFFALSFMIQALGNNFNSGSEEALIYDSMKFLGKEEQYMKVYGRLDVIIEVSQGIATVLGGILAEYSYYYCYGASICIGILALVPVAFMTEVTIGEKEKVQISVFNLVKRHFVTSYEILKNDSRILEINIYYAVIFAMETVLFFYSQQYYYDLGYNKIEISCIFLICGVLACLGAVLSEKIYKKVGKKISVIAAFIFAVTFILYGFQNMVISVLAFSVTNFFNSVLYPVQSEALNGLIPSEQRATLISVNSMIFSVFMIIFFPIAGAVADQWGLRYSFVGTGMVLFIFIILWHKKSNLLMITNE